MTRSEILRRLGVPQFRFRCGQCGGYVSKLVSVFDWDHLGGEAQGHVPIIKCCAQCAKRIDERNRSRVGERVKRDLEYARANEDYRAAQERSSSREYLAACERMRREMGLK